MATRISVAIVSNYISHGASDTVHGTGGISMLALFRKCELNEWHAGL